MIVIIIGLCSFNSALAGNKSIELVQKSTVTGCELTTLGILFNTPNFDNAIWSSFTADSGIEVVEFKGTISESLHHKVMEVLQRNISKGERYILYQKAWNSFSTEEHNRLMQKVSTPAEEIQVFSEAYLDRKAWAVGSMTRVQFLMQGKKSFRIGAVKNETWSSESGNVFRMLCNLAQ